MERGKAVIDIKFIQAMAKLPKQTLGRLVNFIEKFTDDPSGPGLNYERIEGCRDKNMFSVRIDDLYRCVIVRPEQGNVYLLVWVDHHNEAYDWACRYRYTVNKVTGGLQLYEIPQAENMPQWPEVTPGRILPPPVIGPFHQCSDKDLLRLGLPSEQLPLVRKLRTKEEYSEYRDAFPEDVSGYLDYLVNGFSMSEVLELAEQERPKSTTPPDPEDIAAAIESPASRSSIMVIDSHEELRRILSEGTLEEWRVFLHPMQRRLVEADYAGPARVIGGAGTGKTVVAMHRAKHLAARLTGRDKVLFTTFNTNLAEDIEDNLRKICTPEQMQHIEVVNIDTWAARWLKEREGITVLYENADAQLNSIWQEAIRLAEDTSGRTPQFYAEEWSRVVVEQDIFQKEEYLKARRTGRSTRLSQAEREKVWLVLLKYLELLKKRKIMDGDACLRQCRALIKEQAPQGLYPHIVVDEGQDLSQNAYRLLRTLAGKEHPNDIFIVGDAHQRIYPHSAHLSKCGINVRGRGACLRINYRTTEETRRYALALLKDIPFDDLNGEPAGKEMEQSLTHGLAPEHRGFAGIEEESAWIAAEVNKLIAAGEDPRNICVTARTHKYVKEYLDRFAKAGLQVYEIRGSRRDDRSLEGVRIATMHRVKGLEFAYMFAAAVNKNVVPLAAAVDKAGGLARQQALTAEKCLLYVALTRAQKQAYITSFGTPSELL